MRLKPIFAIAGVLCGLLAPLDHHAIAEPKKLTKAEKDKFNTLTTQAANEFKLLDFNKAMEDYKSAFDIDPEPLLLLALGQCYRKLDRYKDAISSYTQFLQAQPDYPERAAVEDSIKALHVLINQGSVELSSTPAQVEVSLDGVSSGETPVTLIAIDPGDHTIQLTKEGFKPYQYPVTIAPGQRLILNLTLETLPGTLEVSSEQGPLTVSIDGLLSGSTPLPPKELSPGKHQLRVTKTGFKAFEEEINIENGKLFTVTPTLEPAVGNIRVKINLVQATISLDGVERGVTNTEGIYFLPGVPAGPHEIVIKLPPLQSITQKFTLEGDTTQEISMDFSGSVTPKILYRVSGASAGLGVATLIAGAAIALNNNGIKQAGVGSGGLTFVVGFSFLGTSFVSGTSGIILSVHAKAKKFVKQTQDRNRRERAKKKAKQQAKTAT